jgi:hypothetical protein
MFNRVTTFLLPAVLLMVSVRPAAALPPPDRDRDWQPAVLNGTAARFTFTGPRRMEMVSGDWNPDTIVTVSQDREGRTVLRFKEPGNPPGFWVKQE